MLGLSSVLGMQYNLCLQYLKYNFQLRAAQERVHKNI